MHKDKIKLLVTDFDGTLAQPDSTVSNYTKDILEKLGNQNIIRAIATGRPYFACISAINNDFPIDYIIYSSGIGIIDYKNDKEILSNALSENETKYILNYAYKLKHNFMVLDKGRNTHKFYFQKYTSNLDFENRLKFYKDFASNKIKDCPKSASQFLIISNSDDVELYEKVKADLQDFNVVRTSSPYLSNTLWIEIFHKDSSKAKASDFLRKKLKIELDEVIVFGNDYNDESMLDWSKNSYVVENSPEDLKQRFKTIDSNSADGLAKFCEKNIL